MFAFDVRGTQVTLHQDPANTATTGTKVWEAAQVLAQYCVVNARKLRLGPGKRCLELGSGCGLVGFTLAILGCEVTLSDQAAGLYLLKKNADLNSQICHVATVTLDWSEELPESIRSGSPFDVVVGADVVYKKDLAAPLVRTLNAVAGPSTVVLIAGEVRDPGADEHFWSLVSEHFTVRRIPPHQLSLPPGASEEALKFVVVHSLHKKRASVCT